MTKRVRCALASRVRSSPSRGSPSRRDVARPRGRASSAVNASPTTLAGAKHAPSLGIERLRRGLRHEDDGSGQPPCRSGHRGISSSRWERVSRGGLDDAGDGLARRPRASTASASLVAAWPRAGGGIRACVARRASWEALDRSERPRTNDTGATRGARRPSQVRDADRVRPVEVLDDEARRVSDASATTNRWNAALR